MDKEREQILKRLRRIEGQVKGIQRMMENDSCCGDVLTQVAAVKAAVNKVGMLIFEHHAQECFLTSLEGKSKEDALGDLMKMMGSFFK